MVYNSSTNLYNTSKFIVDPDGSTPYTTIQSAIDAAVASSPTTFATVYIRPGAYAESLPLDKKVILIGDVSNKEDDVVQIFGTHTPPTSNQFIAKNIYWAENGGSVFSSASSGSAKMILENCAFVVSSGLTFDMPNWTGSFYLNNCKDISTTNNYILQNVNGADIYINNSEVGDGITDVFTTTGNMYITNSTIGCYIQTTSSGLGGNNYVIYNSTINGSITHDSLVNLYVYNSTISSGSATALTYDTGSLALGLYNSIIDSSNVSAITGTSNTSFIATGTTFASSSGIGGSLKPNFTAKTIGNPYLNSANFDGWLSGTDTDLITALETLDELGKILALASATSTLNTIIFNQMSSNSGGDVRFLLENTSNTADSSASLIANVAGTSAGDPMIRVSINGGGKYTLGIDNTDSDKFKVTDGLSPSTGNTLMELTTAGEFTYPKQPAFSAYLDNTVSNVTGDGTEYSPVIYDTEIFDQNTDFNIATGVYTAPVNGKHSFFTSMRFTLGATTPTALIFRIVTSNRNYNITTSSNATYIGLDVSSGNSILADMDAGDTAQVSFQINGTAKVSSLLGDTSSGLNTYFQGKLEC